MSLMIKPLLIPFLLMGSILICCKQSATKEKLIKQKTNIENTLTNSVDSSIIYQTENLVVKKLSSHIYQHISFLNTDDFGKVACNGMLVVNENEGIVFDTPTDNESSMELINFVTKELNSEIIALVPTHFHNDCVGGIAEFEKLNIPTHAHEQTIELLKENEQEFTKPMTDFTDRLTLEVGNKQVYAEYFGEGHTKDNIIGYFPESKTVFGGCLIKASGANKGYLGDANTEQWSKTVRKIKSKYPDVEIVVPGHGKWGGTELFDYTIELFDIQ